MLKVVKRKKLVMNGMRQIDNTIEVITEIPDDNNIDKSFDIAKMYLIMMNIKETCFLIDDNGTNYGIISQ